ncbi:unnamed protein product [Penicillium nalgiovense]|nr:unnamed protein product [Penicillium nalgiovense]
MDQNLSQVPKKSNTPDRGHSGRICQTGIESAKNFRRVGSQFIYGNRDYISQGLQPSVGRSTGSVATEVVTSVATSFAKSKVYTFSPSVIKPESHNLPPLNAKRGAAKTSALPRKRRRHSYSISEIPGHSQLMHRKRLPGLATISRQMVNDTIQYLQSLSDHILISDTILPREWATMDEEWLYD